MPYVNIKITCDIAGHTISIAMLAFSETWIRA